MWHREVQVHRDFFWTGILIGVIIGGVIGVFLGSEAGRRTRNRLEDATLRVRSKMNGVAQTDEARSEETLEAEDLPSES
ncbi:MAG: hypothetical protein ACO36I_20010 [Candidatus Latescibacterota bacterium]|jgi:gas vesicle protein